MQKTRTTVKIYDEDKQEGKMPIDKLTATKELTETIKNISNHPLLIELKNMTIWHFFYKNVKYDILKDRY